MLYLITGGNGAGKTLNALKWAKELADKDARPVAYNGRFDLVEGGPLSNWKKIDFKDWQAEPDGTIFFVDECHNDLPNRSTGSTVPEYVRMLAEHRKRGFDFFLITQHPQNIDVFVRRLIASPGYHRHLKRVFGADLVSVCEWAAVNPQCERPGSSDSGSVTTVAFPKDVYTWYRSAMLHTGKTRIPKAVWMLLACAVAVPLLAWLGLHSLFKPKDATAKAAASTVTSGPATGLERAPGRERAKTGVEYVADLAPRLDGLPYTAPHYDGVTQPKTAPYPAACIDGIRPATKQRECTCYTQQGTKLLTPEALCRQIAANGFFIDWQEERQVKAAAPAAPPAAAAPEPAAAPPVQAVAVRQAPAQARPEVVAGPPSAPSTFTAIVPEPQDQVDGHRIGAMRRGERRLP